MHKQTNDMRPWPTIEIIRKLLRRSKRSPVPTFSFSFAVGEWAVHLQLDPNATDELAEAKRGPISLDGRYSARLDPPRVSPGLHHLHIFGRRGELFAVNIDGTSHDGSRGTRIPNDVADAIREKFPRFRMPPDNVIEWAAESDRHLLFG